MSRLDPNTWDAANYPYPNSAGHVHGSSTSRSAAVKMQPKLGAKQAMVLERIRDRGWVGATDDEIQRELGGTTPWRPRRCELLALGAIRDSGKTRTAASGREQVVWVLA